MRRRDFIGIVGSVAAWPLAARAQQPTIPVIGFLHSESLDAVSKQVGAFNRGLNEAGYIDNQNVAIKYYWAEGQFDRVPALLADLIHRPLTVLVAGGGTIQAVKSAGVIVPTIFTTGADPVQEGLVPSLSRPGGNMTGVTFFVTALGPKELEMLIAAVPSAKLIGFVSDPGWPYASRQLDELAAAVRALGRKIVVQSVSNEAGIEPAFASLSQQGIDALVVGGDPFFFVGASRLLRRRRIVRYLRATVGGNSR